jgi:hypothetical protein
MALRKVDFVMGQKALIEGWAAGPFGWGLRPTGVTGIFVILKIILSQNLGIPFNCIVLFLAVLQYSFALFRLFQIKKSLHHSPSVAFCFSRWFHGTESLLRSRQSLSCSRISRHSVEPEGLLSSRDDKSGINFSSTKAFYTRITCCIMYR